MRRPACALHVLARMGSIIAAGRHIFHKDRESASDLPESSHGPDQPPLQPATRLTARGGGNREYDEPGGGMTRLGGEHGVMCVVCA